MPAPLTFDYFYVTNFLANRRKLFEMIEVLYFTNLRNLEISDLTCDRLKRSEVRGTRNLRKELKSIYTQDLEFSINI